MTEHAQNEASYGEAVFYSKNSMNYIIRGDFKIYKKKELGSIFIEILSYKGKNMIIDCI